MNAVMLLMLLGLGAVEGGEKAPSDAELDFSDVNLEPLHVASVASRTIAADAAGMLLGLAAGGTVLACASGVALALRWQNRAPELGRASEYVFYAGFAAALAADLGAFSLAVLLVYGLWPGAKPRNLMHGSLAVVIAHLAGVAFVSASFLAIGLITMALIWDLRKSVDNGPYAWVGAVLIAYFYILVALGVAVIAFVLGGVAVRPLCFAAAAPAMEIEPFISRNAAFFAREVIDFFSRDHNRDNEGRISQ